MADKKVMLTEEGYNKLVDKVNYLKSVRRIEIAERLKAAIALGDLSENSEYEAAKDEQAFVEGQISTIETKIRYAEIVNSDAVAADEVAIGRTVTVQEVGETEEEVYYICRAIGRYHLHRPCTRRTMDLSTKTGEKKYEKSE